MRFRLPKKRIAKPVVHIRPVTNVIMLKMTIRLEPVAIYKVNATRIIEITDKMTIP